MPELWKSRRRSWFRPSAAALTWHLRGPTPGRASISWSSGSRALTPARRGASWQPDRRGAAMHLKLDSRVTIDDGDVARDLGQDPADIVILSAADSDLSALGAALATMPPDF